MKRFILASIFFTFFILPSMAETKILRRGFYRIIKRPLNSFNLEV
ncbi:hypothetical protein [Clostridium chromiireducens]|nr:hypothetical protein [Clostridium chromiireducens]